MTEPNDQTSTVDRLLAGSLVLQAQVEVLLSMCTLLARRLEINELDGLSLDDWFHREKQKQIDALLISVEDGNPAVAAILQTIVDESRKRMGEEPPTPE
jgi:hypothetical protein